MVTEEQRQKRKEAAERGDTIRVKVPPGFDSTQIIRQFRDSRYGPKRKKRDEPS